MNIKDIASLAGVSAATVSKVLNKKDADISKATREKVLSVVKEYQYVPYSRIRRNTFSNNHTIGVVISDRHESKASLLYSIENAAAKKGYSVMFYNISKDDTHIRVIENKAVDGIVIIASGEESKKLYSEIDTEDLPCILVGGDKDAKISSTISSLETKAAYTATTYLIDMGHVNIGCVVKDKSTIEAGYQVALYEHRIDFSKTNIFSEDLSTEEGRKSLSEWLSQRYTAILCSDTEEILCLHQVFAEKGMQIPEDISIMSMEDSRYLSLLSPTITAIGSYSDKFATQIVGKIISMIENTVFEEREVTFVINERDSVKSPDTGVGQKLIVVGSMNQDITLTVPHIPEGGETMIAGSTNLMPGGKGANQAVGAAKLGARVYLIGSLGNDNAGKELYADLLSHRIKPDGIRFDKTLPTGKAYINVPEAEGGESTIIIYPGANMQLGKKQIRKHQNLFEHAKYCLLSMEIPEDTAKAVIDTCTEKSVKVIMKPSGLDTLDMEMLKGVEYFVPNEKELEHLVPGDMSMEDKVDLLLENGATNVIVTLGRSGAYLKNEKESGYFSAAKFKAIDTTGGADAFVSALAVYLSEGSSLNTAIGYAMYSAGITVTKQGVQTALPDRELLEMYRDEIIRNFGEDA